ncbi:hypothetical protein TRIUR3_26475 [Triticum urartu]|uniref:Uncharacterized protein n=1 Tax=Triticum urartu TaxID=4572 RepID=M8AHY1_TRIUA|nr:hypothetical protein TRIUR3_26475 [Triticum urartu]
MADATAPRPFLRRVLSFREPLQLQLIPYLVGFLGTVASAFFHSYASFLQSFARSIVVPSPAAYAKCAYATSSAAHVAPCCEDVHAEEEEEDEELRKEEVEAIMARIGLGVTAAGDGLSATLGHAEVSRLFDAELRGGAARVRRVRRRRGRVHRRGGPAGRPGQARVPRRRRRRVRGDDLVQLRVHGRQDEPVPVRQVPRGRPLLTDRPASLF